MVHPSEFSGLPRIGKNRFLLHIFFGFYTALEVEDKTKWLIFRKIHVEASLLPMGQVWSTWTSWDSFFSFFFRIIFCNAWNLMDIHLWKMMNQILGWEMVGNHQTSIHPLKKKRLFFGARSRWKHLHCFEVFVLLLLQDDFFLTSF